MGGVVFYADLVLEVRPGEEDCDSFGGWAALELAFDGPWDGTGVVAGEEEVVANCVDVFGIDEQAVHVEETGSDRREAGGCVRSGILRRKRGTDSVFGTAAIMVVSLKLVRCFEVVDLSIEVLRFCLNFV